MKEKYKILFSVNYFWKESWKIYVVLFCVACDDCVGEC